MKRFLFFAFTASLCLGIQAQDEEDNYFMTGLLPDDGTYETLPRKATLLTRDYTLLPESYSLEQYCPKVRSQSRFGTCTSWASVYAARTIAEAIKWDWTDQEKITQEAFSPLFIYAQIKHAEDNECQRGSQIYDALRVMRDVGAIKYLTFDMLCATYIKEELKRQAAQYKIDRYETLFSINEMDALTKITRVKKALTEDRPVVIAMWLPASFHSAKDAWSGLDVDPTKHGYHAMCVVGYDDKKDGGSFHIMNSWGTHWGNNGFTWVKYTDFAKYVDQAYEMYVKKFSYPSPDPIVEENDLSGSIDLQLSTGEKMSPALNTAKGTYHIADDFISGTRYRIYITNNEPAYVYVIGSDLQNNVSKVFPPKDNISALLNYKQNHIAIPDETYYVEMDNTTGTDYMCVLYSKDELNINDIVARIKSGTGSFQDRVKAVLGDKLATANDIRYVMNAISFSAKTEKTVVPVIVELTHK